MAGGHDAGDCGALTMAKSVYEILADNKPSLLERLGQNSDLSNFVLALLSRAIVICAQRGKPLEGIEFSGLQASDLPTQDVVFRARLIFHDMAITAASIWPPQSDFARYARAKAYGLGMALQKNPRLNFFFQAILEHIGQYADRRGLKFGALKVQKAIITTADILVLQVGQNVLTN